jgi:hypothetical protein
MYDDLRQPGDKPLTEFEQPEEQQPGPKRASRRGYRYAQARFLGMTAPQRFVIAVMLLMMTCLLGVFCLLVTQRIVPPFLY